MRKLPKPTDEPGDVFIKCIEIIRDVDLRDKLTSIKDLIVEASVEFEEKVTKGQLYTIIHETKINNYVTIKDLEGVYKRMYNKNTTARIIYEKLINSAKSGICPLCSHREVSQIDHYLPKSHYPKLTVVPVNLIPSCAECNKSKLNNFPKKPEEEMLHPYFDDIEMDIWLTAKISHTTPAKFEFYVTPPDSWDKLLTERVKFHFSKLSLNELYSIHAAVELVQIKYWLNCIYTISSAAGVQKHLLNGALTRNHANLNSWQAAMYKAMAADNWFCDGGFNL